MVDGASGGARPPPPSCIRTWTMAGPWNGNHRLCEIHDSRLPLRPPRAAKNVKKPLRLSVKSSWRIPDAKYLIKPMENEDFWAQNSKKGPKMIKKHYLEKVSQRVFKTSKNLIKPMENTVLQNAKTRCEKPYKTNGIWRLLGPFSENRIKKYQKTITFFTKSWSRFWLLQNIKKPLVKQCFGASKKVDKIPYKTCGILMILGHYRKMASKMIKKALGL